MEILRAEGIRKIYGKDDAEVVAVNHVSLQVEKGDFIAIMGPSGSGKSTFLHILGGVDRPTEGKVFIEGTDVYAQKERQLAVFRRRQIGLIYQFNNLIPVLNVEENIALPLLLDQRSPDPQVLSELLLLLNLHKREKHLPAQLSGGQQQRVSIGRALISNPAIILADEPTGNLDSKSTAEVMELFHTANKKYRQTLILITHDPNIALQADRVITIEDGQIASDERLRYSTKE